MVFELAILVLGCSMPQRTIHLRFFGAQIVRHVPYFDDGSLGSVASRLLRIHEQLFQLGRADLLARASF